MPMYDFYCETCKTHFERQLSFQEAGDLKSVSCPRGHYTIRKAFSAPSIVFKGSGWYSTDHRQPAKSS